MRKMLLFLFAFLLLTACQSVINPIKTEELRSINKSGIQLIDVRTPEEFAEYHIEGAKNIDIFSEDFDEQIQQLDKNEPVYVYCRSGKRSNDAAQKMQKMGFQKIYDLQGGILEWEKMMQE